MKRMFNDKKQDIVINHQTWVKEERKDTKNKNHLLNKILKRRLQESRVDAESAKESYHAALAQCENSKKRVSLHQQSLQIIQSELLSHRIQYNISNEKTFIQNQKCFALEKMYNTVYNVTNVYFNHFISKNKNKIQLELMLNLALNAEEKKTHETTNLIKKMKTTSCSSRLSCNTCTSSTNGTTALPCSPCDSTPRL